MKRMVWVSLALLVIVFVVWACPARSASELCPMGGMMIKTAIAKEKTLDWAKGMPNAVVDGADTDTWTVLARSRTEHDIAMLIGPGYIFFGVAGRGGEVYPRDMDKAFGKDLGKLRETVKREMNQLVKIGVVRIESNDVQKISDAVGRGLLEKVGQDWVLKTSDCQAVDLPASGP